MCFVGTTASLSRQSEASQSTWEVVTFLSAGSKRRANAKNLNNLCKQPWRFYEDGVLLLQACYMHIHEIQVIHTYMYRVKLISINNGSRRLLDM